ncbi:MAG: alpha/beta hydrolase, partial [Candidatus Obscuribacterales bacterium]|nr:alpha/beta hydrolase [Candidatus Obscuribacterales bacterium]
MGVRIDAWLFACLPILWFQFFPCPASAEALDNLLQKDKDKRYEYIDWNSVSGLVKVPLFFATNRITTRDPFDSAAGELMFGEKCVVVPLRTSKEPFEKLGWEVQEIDHLSKDDLLQKCRESKEASLTQNQFRKALQKAVASDRDQRVVVFVHGFNNSFEDALNGGAELSYWYKHPVVVFSWPSAKYTSDAKSAYLNAEKLVDDSADAFIKLITEISEVPGITPKNVTIVAHSMGNHILQDLLKKYKTSTEQRQNPFRELVFCSADLDGADFANDVQKFLKFGNKVRIFFNANDGALYLSAIVHHGKPRLGAVGAHIEKIANLPETN